MSTQTPKLLGKKALVTGGTRGIGLGIARRLVQEGATVAITYVSSPARAEEAVAQLKAEGGQAYAIQADSRDAQAVAAAVDTAAQLLGGLDILVNNAGVAHMAPLEEFTLEDFDRTIEVNVRSVFVASQAAAKHLGAGGRIINIGSSVSERIPFAGAAVYTLSKAAVGGLTRGLARDLGPRGITVNNVQPGPIATDMNPEDGALGDTVRSYLAISRFGKTHEVGAFVAFLASDEAAFITGANLTIDGGFAA